MNKSRGKPGQKYQNREAYKFDKWRTDPKAKMLAAMQVMYILS